MLWRGMVLYGKVYGNVKGIVYGNVYGFARYYGIIW